LAGMKNGWLQWLLVKNRKQIVIPYLNITNDALLVYLLKEKTAGETVQHVCGSLLVKCGQSTRVHVKIIESWNDVMANWFLNFE
jgi:hypothetical protein